jgi:hypothetical protein
MRAKREGALRVSWGASESAQKLDQETSSWRDDHGAPGASSSTVTPSDEERMGRSARRPLTGLTKTQAGTAPISALSAGVACFAPNAVVPAAAAAADAKRPASRPTMHHPSSYECTTVSCSPRESTSSSGKTGLNIWRTLRDDAPAPDALLPALSRAEMDKKEARLAREPPPRPPPSAKKDDRQELRSASGVAMLMLILALLPCEGFGEWFEASSVEFRVVGEGDDAANAKWKGFGTPVVVAWNSTISSFVASGL